jgi:hypothetical protein
MTARHKLIAALAVVVTLPSCATAEAIKKLPEGYWLATERLVIAVLEDLWSLVSWMV